MEEHERTLHFTIKQKQTIFWEMEKIEYQAPVMEIVKLRGPQVLLEGSGTEAGGGGTGFARETDFEEE